MIMLSGDTSDELELNLESQTEALGYFMISVETLKKVLFSMQIIKVW